jgi:RNA polymerase sigma factor (sigma-70 family)
MVTGAHELAEAHVHVVKAIAVRLWRANHRRPDLEEMVSEGYVALCQVAGRYDAKHPSGASFHAFVGAYIEFAIRESLRRGRRERGFVRLKAGGMRQRIALVPIDDVSDDGTVAERPIPSDEPSPLELLEVERWRADALATPMTDRERSVIALRLTGQAQVDVARALRVTPGRVSQLENAAIKKIRIRCGVVIMRSLRRRRRRRGTHVIHAPGSRPERAAFMKGLWAERRAAGLSGRLGA